MATKSDDSDPDDGGPEDGGRSDESRDEMFVSRMNASQRQLRAFLVGLAPASVDADDLLQEVNLALWRKRDQYDPSQDYTKWAFGFAALELRSQRRKSAQDRHWFSDSTIELLASDWQQSSHFLDDCRLALATCLQKLGKPEREVVEAKYARQLTMKQIASETGRPQSTIYKVFARALKSLRECVHRYQLQSP